MHVNELYASVTATIVKALESNSLPPWRRPWLSDGGFLPLRHSGIPYRGVNVFILFIEADARGFNSPHWMTFAQAQEYGGNVRKGEKSTPILYCQPVTKRETAEDGKEQESRFFLSKVYRVFNCQQIEGLPERFTVKSTHQIDAAQRIEHADAFLKNTGADIRHNEGAAYYRPLGDFINMPPFESFESPEAYYSTCLHEVSHWTGATHRLARFDTEKRSREDYAKEEITAELSSVLLAAQLGIMPPSLDQHAAYLDHWIKAMRQDPKYIFTAAACAQKAVDYLNSLQPSPDA